MSIGRVVGYDLQHLADGSDQGRDYLLGLGDQKRFHLIVFEIESDSGHTNRYAHLRFSFICLGICH
jgi:hypothetical protein